MKIPFEKTKHISISAETILLAVFIPLGLYFLWTIKDILFALLIGFILMSALRPLVSFLTKKRLPRPLAVGVVYVLFITVVATLFLLIIPPIVQETGNLVVSLPPLLSEIYPRISINDFSQYLPDATNNIVGFVSGVFSNAFFVVTTLFFSLYFLLDENLLENIAPRFLSKEKSDTINKVLQKAEKRMSSWFWGQLSLMIIVGVATYAGLSILGVKYALPLAVFAGLLEVVPNIGPILSAIPAILIASTSSVFSGVSTLALYIIVQQLENSVIVPYIMKKAVGLSPIVTLTTLLVGGKIGGVVGVILAIPLYLFIETVVHEYRNQALNMREK